jgi:hypothetical protein
MLEGNDPHGKNWSSTVPNRLPYHSVKPCYCITTILLLREMCVLAVATRNKEERWCMNNLLLHVMCIRYNFIIVSLSEDDVLEWENFIRLNWIWNTEKGRETWLNLWTDHYYKCRCVFQWIGNYNTLVFTKM